MRDEINKLRRLAQELVKANSSTYSEHKPHQENKKRPKKEKPKKKEEPKKKEQEKEADIEFIRDKSELPEGARQITNIAFVNADLRDGLADFIKGLKEGLPDEVVREQLDSYLAQNMAVKNDADQVSFRLRAWKTKDFNFSPIASWICSQKTVYKDTLEDAF